MLSVKTQTKAILFFAVHTVTENKSYDIRAVKNGIRLSISQSIQILFMEMDTFQGMYKINFLGIRAQLFKASLA